MTNMTLQITEKKSHIILFTTFGVAVFLGLAIGSFSFYPLLSAGWALIISPASLESYVDSLSRDGFSSEDHAVSKLSIAAILFSWTGILLFGIFTKGIAFKKRIAYLLLFASQFSTVFFYIRVILMGDAFSSFL